MRPNSGDNSRKSQIAPMNPSPLLPRSLDNYQICNINAKICTFIFWIRIFWAYNMENPGKGLKLSTVGPIIKIQKFNYNVSLIIWVSSNFALIWFSTPSALTIFLKKNRHWQHLMHIYYHIFHQTVNLRSNRLGLI